MTGAKKQPKSIFDDKFEYLKMPIEALRIPKLRCAERMILSRIIFWTRKGMPCTHTNAQLGELISQTERNAGRAVQNLIRLKHIDAIYRNNHKTQQKNCYRELTALVAVKPEMVLKRKAIQVARALKAEKKSSGQNRPATTTHKNGHQDKMSTSSGHNVQVGGGENVPVQLQRTKKQLRALPSPPPANGQASATQTDRQKIRDDYRGYIREEKEELLIEMYKKNTYGYQWLIDELRPEIKEKCQMVEV